jgi:branched-chain amino acid transport system ATP-binding protein
MKPLLEAVGVTKAFGGVLANDGVGLAVPEGAIVGLIGPNGSGKTTLFNAITGAHAIDAGGIRFKGKDISRLLAGDIARAGIIRTYQQPRIYGGLTTRDNVIASVSVRRRSFVSLFGGARNHAERRVDELLDFVDLTEKSGIPAGDLSFGQQKLLELAMALANEPELLLLDEPTAGINPTLVNGVIDRLKVANSALGVTLLIIEHNMPVIMDLAEHIYCLAHGRLLAAGSPEEIQNDPRVLDAYLGAA